MDDHEDGTHGFSAKAALSNWCHLGGPPERDEAGEHAVEALPAER